ncbi:hypothetical protein C8Q76DRAFT_18271 [Earliella scabrosa]|nr:hypothetical protein C8Q76DRAFT_18271 [Earliella scabrosa]
MLSPVSSSSRMTGHITDHICAGGDVLAIRLSYSVPQSCRTSLCLRASCYCLRWPRVPWQCISGIVRKLISHLRPAGQNNGE